MSNTTGEKLKSFTVRLSPKVTELIRSSAKERKVTQSELIADSVQYYLRYKEQDKEG
ncbi:MAG: ribbon-helix-helix protein, CopG family, partial [Atopobium sp.]|nr:ribbon-helix-helix protein, CopG family [Atopobium sp.]